jgi:hypothetical protein
LKERLCQRTLFGEYGLRGTSLFISGLFCLRRFFLCYVQTTVKKLRFRWFSPWFARASPRCICHRQRLASHSLKRKSGKELSIKTTVTPWANGS